MRGVTLVGARATANYEPSWCSTAGKVSPPGLLSGAAQRDRARLPLALVLAAQRLKALRHGRLRRDHALRRLVERVRKGLPFRACGKVCPTSRNWRPGQMAQRRFRVAARCCGPTPGVCCNRRSDRGEPPQAQAENRPTWSAPSSARAAAPPSKEKAGESPRRGAMNAREGPPPAQNLRKLLSRVLLAHLVMALVHELRGGVHAGG